MDTFDRFESQSECNAFSGIQLAFIENVMPGQIINLKEYDNNL